MYEFSYTLTASLGTERPRHRPRTRQGNGRLYNDASTRLKHRITGIVLLILIALWLIPYILAERHFGDAPLTISVVNIPRPLQDSPGVSGCILQLGSFTKLTLANSRRAEVHKHGFDVQVHKVTVGDKVYYRTWLGPFDSIGAAQQIIAELKAKVGDGEYATLGC